jgi:hypothetical protein
MYKKVRAVHHRTPSSFWLLGRRRLRQLPAIPPDNFNKVRGKENNAGWGSRCVVHTWNVIDVREQRDSRQRDFFFHGSKH